jgi:predicted amino acid dehydrogenase
MDLRQDFRTRYTQNKTSLLNLKTQLAGINTGGGGGCYLATMVYGDYDHPQVMILRQFRDEVLDKSALGKWFIKTYYHYSPKLVERLKNERTVNFIIRKALNQFIKLIK